MINEIKAKLIGSYRKPLLFFSLHKSGSTLMGSHLLNKAVGAKHLDLDRYVIERKSLGEEHESSWDNLFTRGKVIGPIRVNTYDTSQVMMEYRETVTSPVFINRFRVSVMVRDPRDILVSSYYSFKKTHKLSPNPTLRKAQEDFRNKLLQMNLSEFVNFYLPNLKSTMQEMVRICELSPGAVVLKYEDLVHDWQKFKKDVEKILVVSEKALSKLYQESRPRAEPDLDQHKRSGKTGQYRFEMDDITIRRVNAVLNESLSYFHYEI